MNKTVITVLVAALVGGAAVAAYQNLPLGDYAEIVRVEPITETVAVSGQVIEAVPLVETRSGPREVCEEQAVSYQEQPKDPNRIAGTAIGAVVGGLIGNQIGGGSGKKIATVAGAAGGAYAGRKVQGNRQEANAETVTRMETVCQTITETRDEIVGYDVTYQVDGETGTRRTSKKPGATVSLGNKEQVVGYDVTYRFEDQLDTVRTEEDPGEPGTRIPVRDGVVQLDITG